MSEIRKSENSERGYSPRSLVQELSTLVLSVHEWVEDERETQNPQNACKNFQVFVSFLLGFQSFLQSLSRNIKGHKFTAYLDHRKKNRRNSSKETIGCLQS